MMCSAALFGALLLAPVQSGAADVGAPDEAALEEAEPSATAKDASPPPPLDPENSAEPSGTPPEQGGEGPVPPSVEAPPGDGRSRNTAPASPGADDQAVPAPDKKTRSGVAEGGIDPAAFLVQVGAGFLTSVAMNLPLALLSTVLNYVPGVNVVAAFVMPIIRLLVRYAASATVITLVGDAMTEKRGSIIWPALASGATSLVCNGLTVVVVLAIIVLVVGVVGAGSYFALYSELSNPSPDFNRINAVAASFFAAYSFGILAALATAVILGLAAEVSAQTAGTYAYHVSAEAKQPNDDGDFRLPGVLTPNHPRDKPVTIAHQMRY